MSADVIALPVTAPKPEPEPEPLSVLGPMTDRDWRVYAIAYATGRADADGEAYDHGYLAGVQVLLDVEPTVPPRRHLRAVPS